MNHKFKKEITELAKSIVTLRGEAARETLLYWQPEVERIIRSKSQDIEAIEHALDALGEVAFDESVLIIFKKLCRYYYDIDPYSTVKHIQFYREMWDSEE